MPNPFSKHLRKGKLLGSLVPTQVVSNEEFAPFEQTEDQARVEWLTTGIIERSAARQGLSRRDFLKRTGGMAASFLAMNAVFGRFFNIENIELFETDAFAEQQGAPYFI